MRLPTHVQLLLWDYAQGDVAWPRDADLVIQRVLTRGTDRDWRWLRDHVGDAGLNEWIVRTRGRALDPRQLRYWQLILDLPSQLVDPWVARARASTWHQRTKRHAAPRGTDRRTA